MPPAAAAVARSRSQVRPNLTRSRSAASLSRRKALAANQSRNPTPRNQHPQHPQPNARPSPPVPTPNLVRSKSASSVGRRSRASSRRHYAPPNNNRQRNGGAANNNVGGGGGASARQKQYQYQQALYRAKGITPPASQYHLQPVALNASSANGAGASSIAARKVMSPPAPILRNPPSPASPVPAAKKRFVRWNFLGKKNTNNTTPTPPPTTATPTATPTPNPVLVQQQLRRQSQSQRYPPKTSSATSTSQVFRQGPAKTSNSLVIRPGNNNFNTPPLALRSNNVPPFRSPNSQARGGKPVYGNGSVVRYNAAANAFGNGNRNNAFGNGYGNTRTMRSIRYQGTAPNGMAMRRMVNYSATRSGMRPVPMGLFGSSKGSSSGGRLILIDGMDISNYCEGVQMPYSLQGVILAIKYYELKGQDWVVLVDEDSFMGWEEENPDLANQLIMNPQVMQTPSGSAFPRFLARIGAEFEADIVTNNEFFEEKESQVDPMLLRSTLDRLVIPFVIFRDKFIPQPESCRILEGLHGPRPPMPQLEDDMMGDGGDMGMQMVPRGPGGQSRAMAGRNGGGMALQQMRMRNTARMGPAAYRGSGNTLPAAYRARANRGVTTNARMAAYRREMGRKGGRR